MVGALDDQWEPAGASPSMVVATRMISSKGSTPRDSPGGQDRLGTKGLVIFLALLSAFVPLSTDLYLPALPTLTKYFHVPEYQTNLTLILFFVFYSLATLVWGR